MNKSKFKILSLDGGGIRGVFSSMFLANVESYLERNNFEKTKIHEHFDLIVGTSTGGILAIALALGIPAKDIYDLYIQNAKVIFGNKRYLINQIFNPAHGRNELEKLIRNKFKEVNNGEDPRLNDCKTHVAVPIYDLMEGRPSVLKTKYHSSFVRDFHIPAYVAALATSAAPTFFNPYNAEYTEIQGLNKTFHNKIDGGVFANNPSLNAIIEAKKAFNIELEDISVLSIGTGHRKFCDAGVAKKLMFWEKIRNNYGLYYWVGKKRIIEVFMQGQAQQTENLISILKKRY